MFKSKPTPRLSIDIAKKARFRILRRDNKFYPQEKWLGIWWGFTVKGYNFVTEECGTLEEAENAIKARTESAENKPIRKTSEVKAYYSKTGAMYV